MRNIIIIVSILVVPFVALVGLSATGLIPDAPRLYGRISLALVFAFTGLGHLVQSDGMMAMLPPRVPARRALILASGPLEWALGAALLVPGWSRPAGLAVVAFLIALFPSNVYAAIHRVPFGGHGRGPSYLIPRGALQLLLIGWTLFFAR